MLVANTANRNIVTINFNPDGTAAATGATLVNGINGPDGIAIDGSGNTWVAANQSDEIVVIGPIPPRGQMPPRVIAKLGDFGGIDSQGRVVGLLFPASLAFSNDGRELYVANAAFTSARSIDTRWTQQVTTYTVSKIVLRTIPPTGLFLPRP